MYALPTDKLRGRDTERMSLVEYLEHEKQYRLACLQDYEHLKALGAHIVILERKRLECLSLGMVVS